MYLVSDRFDCAAKLIVRWNSVGTGGVLFPGTAMVKKRHITSLFLPNDCGQARRGEAPELSVMIWMGCLGLNLPVGDPAVFVENLNLMLTI